MPKVIQLVSGKAGVQSPSQTPKPAFLTVMPGSHCGRVGEQACGSLPVSQSLGKLLKGAIRGRQAVFGSTVLGDGLGP